MSDPDYDAMSLDELEAACDYVDTYPDQDELSWDTIEDAVEELLDVIDGPLPETVQLAFFKRMAKPPVNHIADAIREALFEYLDDHCDLGGPDGPTYEHPAITAAIDALAEAAHQHYTPWACELVHVRTAKLADVCPDLAREMGYE